MNHGASLQASRCVPRSAPVFKLSTPTVRITPFSSCHRLAFITKSQRRLTAGKRKTYTLSYVSWKQSSSLCFLSPMPPSQSRPLAHLAPNVRIYECCSAAGGLRFGQNLTMGDRSSHSKEVPILAEQLMALALTEECCQNGFGKV